MYSSTTTQPAMAEPAKTRAPWITEGIRLILSIATRMRHRRQKPPVGEMNREQLIDQLIREGHLHCHGGDKCTSCEAFIKDVIGN